MDFGRKGANIVCDPHSRIRDERIGAGQISDDNDWYAIVYVSQRWAIKGDMLASCSNVALYVGRMYWYYFHYIGVLLSIISKLSGSG